MYKIYEFIQEMVNTSDTTEKLIVYKEWNLQNCRIFLFDEEKSSFAKVNSNFPTGNYQLVGLADYSKTWVIDQHTDKPTSIITLERHAYYDLNELTYIKNLYQDRHIPNREEFIDFLEFIKKEEFTHNIPDALMERYCTSLNEQIFYETIEAYAYFCDLSFEDFLKKDKSSLSYENYKWITDTINFSNSLFKNHELDRHFTAIVCYIMKAFLLKNSKMSIETKVKKFLDYCLDSLSIFLEFEFTLLVMYLTNDESASQLFSKLQISAKKLFENIYNTAWDIYHVRLLEKFLLADNDNTNVISLPYFATADKKLVEAIQSNPIKLIVLYDGTITTIRNNNFKDYLSEEEMQKIRLGVSERIKRAKFVNFEKEKVKLEKEIIAMRDKK